MVAGVGACSEMTLGNGTSEPSSSTRYPSSIASQYSPSTPTSQNCWLSSDTECAREQANQAATEAKLEQLRREEVHNREVMREESDRQQQATMLAAGLDPDTGRGFWCFEGTQGEHRLGECRRTEDQCIDRLLWREGKGMKMSERKCTRHAQAACFRLTRTLEEGERFMCFDSVNTCEQVLGTVDAEGFEAPPSECAVSS
ncbi:MAG: hypothetical protein AAF799_40070 [Myxococcota bacterium]